MSKAELKLQQRLNRISNLMVGNQRIWNLDRLAMELDVAADMVDCGDIDGDADGLRRDAVFLRRLEYDLGELHVAVRGDTARRGGRYDQSQWKGQRP